MSNKIHNKNIESETVITSPIELKKTIPVSDNGKENILTSRKTVDNIFSGKDERLMVIMVGKLFDTLISHMNETNR